MSILRAGSEAIKSGFSAFERAIKVVDNVARMGEEVSGAGVDISKGWRSDIILTSEISREERRIARDERRSHLNDNVEPQEYEEPEVISR